MKKSEIVVGGLYTAKVSNKLTTVRVDAIHGWHGVNARNVPHYDVTNLATGCKITFRSVQKFRGTAHLNAGQDGTASARSYRGDNLHAEPAPTEAKQYTDPTLVSTSDQDMNPPSSLAAAAVLAVVHPVSPAPSLPASNGRVSDNTIPAIVAGYMPTEEQRAGLEAATSLFARTDGPRVLVLVAGAGAGKTSELKMIESVLSGRGQYTAFNKSLVEDSRPKFKHAQVNTTHSLAFRDVGRRYAHRLGGARIRSDQVAWQLGIEGMHVPTGEEKEDGTPKTKYLQAGFLAGQVLVAIRSFCQSADPEIGLRHFRYIDGIDQPDEAGRTYANNDLVKEYLLPFATRAWSDMADEKGTLPFSHDCYVKLWQLGVGGVKPYIPADYILLDEYQDTAPVFVDVLKQQTHAMLIMVGDDNQRIYEWRGAINAGDEFPDAPRSMLSQSFRFGQVIADVANTVLSTLEVPTQLRMTGNPAIPSRVSSVTDPDCILCRTNACALGYVLRAVTEGKRPHLIGGSKEVVVFVRGALSLQSGCGTDHPELACFSSWTEVQEYSKMDEGEDLRLMVKLIDSFGCEDILSALEDMPSEDEADLVVSTAHKSKGREWPTVKLAEDFPLADRMSDSDRRLLYVALTRAQEQLDISYCPPFCGGRDSKDTSNPEKSGAFVPGLTIRYTVPMPSESDLAEYRSRKGEVEETDTESVPANSEGHGIPISDSPPLPLSRPANVVPSEGFTWAKHEGQWAIRGPKDSKTGEEVTVVRRNGSTSREVLGKILTSYNGAAIYSVGR